MHNAFNEIFEYVKGLTIVDSHEHLPHREDARERITMSLWNIWPIILIGT